MPSTTHVVSLVCVVVEEAVSEDEQSGVDEDLLHSEHAADGTKVNKAKVKKKRKKDTANVLEVRYVWFSTNLHLNTSKSFLHSRLNRLIFVHPTLPMSFGRDIKSRWSLLSGVYARGSKRSHAGKWKKPVIDSQTLEKDTLKTFHVVVHIVTVVK